MDALFDELEALFAKSHEYANHHALRPLLEAAYARDEARYRDVWLPYLSQHDKMPVCFAHTLDEVALLGRLLPDNARLTLWVEDPRFDYGALSNAPQAERLTGITINYRAKLGDAGFARMMASPHLGRVVRLDAGGSTLGDDAMVALAEAASIDGLEFICLYHNALGPRGAAALAGSPKMRALATLDISHNRIGDDGLAAIGASPHLGNLRELNVRGNVIKRRGVEAFAKTTTLVQLTTLNLGQNNVGNNGALALAGCPTLSNLTTLNVGRARVNAKGLGYLRASEHLTKLERLQER